MEILNSFLGQGMVAQIGEIVLFANTVTMAMPTRWSGVIVYLLCPLRRELWLFSAWRPVLPE